MRSTTATILQWNIQGVKNKKPEIVSLVHRFKADVIVLQETLTPLKFLHKIPGYTVVGSDGTYNRRNHGGVATYIHQDIPFSSVSLDTPIQAIATTIHLKSKFTICNIYSSRSHQFNLNDLHNLYIQLPKPCMMLGDFNAYHPLWGCHTADSRGRVLHSFINTSDLIIMNNGAPTHPNPSIDTAIDLSLCSPSISEIFEWNTSF